MFGLFKGYKTYIVGGLTVVGALVSLLVGDADIAQTAQLVVTAVLGMTVRNAIPAPVKV